MQDDSNYQEDWFSDMKKELLSLVDLYQAHCSCDRLHDYQGEMPNWGIIQQAIINTESPEALIGISEKLVQINSLILKYS